MHPRLFRRVHRDLCCAGDALVMLTEDITHQEEEFDDRIDTLQGVREIIERLTFACDRLADDLRVRPAGEKAFDAPDLVV